MAMIRPATTNDVPRTDPAFGHLSRLYVEEARWGQGIGRALHDAAVIRVVP